MKCDSEQCPVKHYHMKCLKLKSVPKKWLCPNCKKNTESVKTSAKEANELDQKNIEKPIKKHW